MGGSEDRGCPKCLSAWSDPGWHPPGCAVGQWTKTEPSPEDAKSTEEQRPQAPRGPREAQGRAELVCGPGGSLRLPSPDVTSILSDSGHGQPCSPKTGGHSASVAPACPLPSDDLVFTPALAAWW